MIIPKLGGEPIPCAFCHVPKYEVFPGLYIYIYTVQLNSNLTLVFDYSRFFSYFLRVSDQ